FSPITTSVRRTSLDKALRLSGRDFGTFPSTGKIYSNRQCFISKTSEREEDKM
ncbi:hypothetical protein TNCT_39011, partial [Trichonephila clavata]